MERDDLRGDLEREFERLREEIGFDVTFEDFNREFYLVDSVLEDGYIRENFILQVTSKVITYFRNWSDYLNNLLMPSSHYFVSQTEAKLFNSEEDKKEIWNIIKICMQYSSMYSLMFMNEDVDMQKDFVNKTYVEWKEVVKPYLSSVLKRVNDGWSS